MVFIVTNVALDGVYYYYHYNCDRRCYYYYYYGLRSYVICDKDGYSGDAEDNVEGVDCN